MLWSLRLAAQAVPIAAASLTVEVSLASLQERLILHSTPAPNLLLKPASRSTHC